MSTPVPPLPPDPTSPEDIETGSERRLRPRSPVALVFGMLFVALGAAVLFDEAGADIDVSSITAVGAVVAGLAVIALMLRR